MNYGDYILPLLLVVLFAISLLRRVPLFDAFVEGAKEALKVVAGVFPYLAAVFVCISLFRASGIESALSDWLAPLFEAIGVPAPLAPMVMLKPLSGSGSIAYLDTVLAAYGADSYIGRCASVMAGVGETVLYVGAVYLGTVKEKKLRYGLPVALASVLFGAFVSCWICRIL